MKINQKEQRIKDDLRVKFCVATKVEVDQRSRKTEVPIRRAFTHFENIVITIIMRGKNQ